MGLASWQHIWLNEGFACYAEWLWSEDRGDDTADQLAERYRQGLLEQPEDLVVGDPGAKDMFDDRVYKRGALALHALRRTIGDERFFGLIQEWTSKYRYSTVATADFTDLASRFGCPRSLWDAWLVDTQLPSLP